MVAMDKAWWSGILFFCFFALTGLTVAATVGGILHGTVMTVLLLVFGLPTAVLFPYTVVTHCTMVEESFKELDEVRGTEL